MDASRDSRDISLRIDFVSSIKSGIEPKGGEEEWSRWKPRTAVPLERRGALRLQIKLYSNRTREGKSCE